MADGRLTVRTSHCPFAFLPVLKTPEKLVGVGFRSWIAGYQTGEIACWEEAWKAYSDALGPAPAREVVSTLACWVRSIKENARREIEVFPVGCRGFCHDECVAISMVAACQYSAGPIIRGCATTLLGSSTVADCHCDDVRVTVPVLGVLAYRDEGALLRSYTEASRRAPP